MAPRLEVHVRHRPELDPGFLPAVCWNRAYAAAARASRGSVPLGLALLRRDGTVFTHRTRILPPSAADQALNLRYVERLVKFLLWQKGGSTVLVSGSDPLARALEACYGAKGARAFDWDFLGRRVFGQPIQVKAARKLPSPREAPRPLGRHLDGCRIGFDLGGSDRKSAALIDGRVVFSDEVKWNPYFEKDPSYHLEGVNDSIRRAAAHLPRIDAIGGSAAGVYVNSEPRVGSLYRGISEPDFDRHVRGLFRALQQWWGGVPFEVANDGEVTALAGSMSLRSNAVLGISLGTSTAAGYVTPDGSITPWLNELAFVPVDYRDDAPADEWSGDPGVGAQYFSQQAVGRLLPAAGIELPAELPLAERLVELQRLMAGGDARAHGIYRTIGVYLGYGIAHFADFYAIESVLILGRVTSGAGGDLIVETAGRVLKDEFPALAERIRLRTPDEQEKRHGQAIAAASLAPPQGVRGARRQSAPRGGRGGAAAAPPPEGLLARPRHAARLCSERPVPTRGERLMRFSRPDADVFVPDGTPLPEALRRATHVCVGAHQDDQEFMAFHGIAECFGRKDRGFAGVVVTNGGGSSRSGIYADYSDERMIAVRVQEQRKAATIGEYACEIQLMHPSADVKRAGHPGVAADLAAIFAVATPALVYVHNPADKHDTHVAVCLRTLAALRAQPPERRPKRLLGCEIWRDLDWLNDADKQLLPVDSHKNLAAALSGVFDSQITGGKRYDAAVAGRRMAHATFFESHATDKLDALNFAMDLTPLLLDDSLDVLTYTQGLIRAFEDEVRTRLLRLT